MDIEWMVFCIKPVRQTTQGISQRRWYQLGNTRGEKFRWHRKNAMVAV